MFLIEAQGKNLFFSNKYKYLSKKLRLNFLFFTNQQIFKKYLRPYLYNSFYFTKFRRKSNFKRNRIRLTTYSRIFDPKIQFNDFKLFTNNDRFNKQFIQTINQIKSLKQEESLKKFITDNFFLKKLIFKNYGN